MLFNLVFANNIILLFFFFFLLIIKLYFFNFAVIAQISNPKAELVIPKGKPSKEAKAEIEMHSVTAEAKIRKVFNISGTNLLVLFTHEFTLLYETIPCFIYIFQSKFLAYVFSNHVFKVIYFQLNEEFLTSQLILPL